MSVFSVVALLAFGSVSQVSACEVDFFSCFDHGHCRFMGLKCAEGLHRSAQHLCHQEDTIYERFLWGCAWDMSHQNWANDELYQKAAEDCKVCFAEKMDGVEGVEDPAEMCPDLPFMTEETVSYWVDNKPCSEQPTVCMCDHAPSCKAVTKEDGDKVELLECVESGEGRTASMEDELDAPDVNTFPCEELYNDEEMCAFDARCMWDGEGCTTSELICVNASYIDQEHCEADDRCHWSTEHEMCEEIIDEPERSVATDFSSSGVLIRWIFVVSGIFAVAFVFSRIWKKAKAPTAYTAVADQDTPITA